MSNTYTWKILNLETIPSINGLENVVSVVRWLLTATNDGNVSTVEGTVELENPLVEEFIAYSDLTEEKVLEWTKLKLGNQETQYYQYLDEQLFKLARPQSTAAELPWGII
jgi:hypothetical protein